MLIIIYIFKFYIILIIIFILNCIYLSRTVKVETQSNSEKFLTRRWKLGK